MKPSLAAKLTMLTLMQNKRLLAWRADHGYKNTKLMRTVVEHTLGHTPLPKTTELRQHTLAGYPVDQLINTRADAVAGRQLVYWHGGGFMMGSAKAYRGYAARLMQDCRATSVYIPDYPLAPEAPYPVAINWATVVWRELTEAAPKAEWLLAGESAGGHLCLRVALDARDQGLIRPTRMALHSPWVDLRLSSDSQISQDAHDPLLGRLMMEREFMQHYAPVLDRKNPRLSPLFAPLHDLPPMLVSVGSREVLLDDSVELVKRAQAAGTTVTYQHFEGLWHAFALFTWVPESRAHRKQMGKWLAGQI